MATLSTNRARVGAGCLMLFAVPFAAVGVGLTWWNTRILLQHEAMQEWVEVPAVVHHAELKRKRGKNNDTFQAVATYEYEFGGRRFTGERVGLHAGSDNMGGFQREAYQELKRHLDEKKPFRCFVNPQQPSESVLYRRLRWEMAAFFTAFAALFGGAGFGMMTGAVITGRRAPALAASPADQPWLARSDWATGQVAASGGAAVAAPILAVLTLWWAIASAPLVWKMPGIIESAETPCAWTVLAVPIVGALLAGAFLYQLVRSRKFGESMLQMAATPGVVGGQLAGVVRISKMMPADEGFRIKLSCLETTRDNDENQRKKVLWQDEQLVQEPMRDGLTGAVAVPVLFAIPYSAPETSRSAADREIEWRLEVEASMPGVDYQSQFEVPVFKTADSRRDFAIDERLVRDFAAAPARDLLLREAGILKQPLAGEGLRLVFPAARNMGSAIGLTLFLALWSGAIWLMLRLELPAVFPIVFGLIELALIWIVLDLWLYRSVAEVTRDGLATRGGLLGIGRRRYVAAENVRRFQSREYMASGTRRWTSIYVVPRKGKETLIAKGISSKLVQDAVLEEIGAALEGRAAL